MWEMPCVRFICSSRQSHSNSIKLKCFLMLLALCLKEMFCFWKLTDSSEDEDSFIGPMPAKGPVESDVAKEFERRAQRMKEKLTSADSVSWIS